MDNETEWKLAENQRLILQLKRDLETERIKRLELERWVGDLHQALANHTEDHDS